MFLVRFHFNGIGGADLNALLATDTFLGGNDGLPVIIHLDSIFGTGALTAGATGNTFTCD